MLAQVPSNADEYCRQLVPWHSCTWKCLGVVFVLLTQAKDMERWFVGTIEYVKPDTARKILAKPVRGDLCQIPAVTHTPTDPSPHDSNLTSHAHVITTQPHDQQVLRITLSIRS